MSTTEIVEIKSDQGSYYRSQLYTSYQGINPLITAAHPILSIIDRIKLSHAFTVNHLFYANLQHELKAFKSRAQQANYDEETVFIASFLLSATLDEIAINRNQFDTFKQLMPSQAQQDNTPDIQFFKIIDRIIDKPEHYLDLLELIYLCLSLGFEGKYKHQAHEKLSLITQQLYQTITSVRTQQQKNLFKTAGSSLPASTTAHWSMWLAAVVIIISLFYLGSNWVLDKTLSNTLINTAIITDN